MKLSRRCLPFALVVATSAWMAFANTSTGDFPGDAGPVVHSIAHGHLSALLHSHAIMGPFAILLEAPFVALGAGPLAEYQWACLPCLLAVGLLGVHLARIAGRRGASPLSQTTIAFLCLFNPLTVEALQNGHPEELLTAALFVSAVATASEDREWQAALLLGLAIASKQWAVIAALPVLMALPARRLRVAIGAGAVVLVLVLPGVLASPGSFFDVQSHAASTGRIVDPWNVWYPLGSVTVERLGVGSNQVVAHVHQAPALVGRLSHSLIGVLALAMPLALALRRRRFGLSGADAMALVALLALLRCALDPVGNLYYHAPLLLALFGWDAFSLSKLPWRGLAGVALAAFFWRWSHDLSDPQALNAAYIGVVATVSLAIGFSLFAGRSSVPIFGETRSRVFGDLKPNLGLPRESRFRA